MSAAGVTDRVAGAKWGAIIGQHLATPDLTLSRLKILLIQPVTWLPSLICTSVPSTAGPTSLAHLQQSDDGWARTPAAVPGTVWVAHGAPPGPRKGLSPPIDGSVTASLFRPSFRPASRTGRHNERRL